MSGDGTYNVSELGAEPDEMLDPAPIATYTLTVLGPYWMHGVADVKIAPDILRETEENVSDLLPEGFRVEIKEWDA